MVLWLDNPIVCRKCGHEVSYLPPRVSPGDGKSYHYAKNGMNGEVCDGWLGAPEDDPELKNEYTVNPNVDGWW